MKAAIRETINMSWPTIAIVVSILIIMRVAYLINGERKKLVLHEELFILMFIVYLLILFRLVTSQDLPGGGTNLIPFKEIMRYKVGTNSFYRQVVGNILLFIPLGYFATSFCKIKKLWGITVVSLLSSFTIECVQHFIGRSFEDRKSTV